MNNRSIWERLERFKLARKLFLWRKLYLSQTSFRHYSQFAEDASIHRCFPIDFKGFFVDVGCFHPKKYNNTWVLYQKGWRGINIDLDPIKIEAFEMRRPSDWNVASAVSDQEGEVSYFSDGFYSLTTSLSQDFASRRRQPIEKRTTSRTLTRIIDDSPYKDRRIDFLTVDAETHDLEVLKSLDFERYQPRLMAVETHLRSFGDVEQSELYQWIHARDYSLVGWCGLTLLMADPELQEQLRSQPL